MVDSELDLLHRSWMRALKARNLAVKTLRTYGDNPNAPRARHRVGPLPGAAAVLHVGGAKVGQALDRHLRARAKHRRSFEQALWLDLMRVGDQTHTWSAQCMSFSGGA